MESVDAEVWVLTEAHLDRSPGAGYEAVFSPEHTQRRPGRERWTAVWSRYPIVETPEVPGNRRGTVAAVVDAPPGPILVYGTVIAWANEKHFDDGRPARMWEVHRAEIERQAHEWSALRSAYPRVPLIVAGDFNQSRDGSRWYGEQRSRNALTEHLSSVRLRCVTEEDFAASGRLTGHLVDHICVSDDVKVGKVEVWDRCDDAGQRLSDHPTVAVDLDL
jgi:endonuclease/exonuclease/phosphatase family metal-dependent hydrolase